MRACVQRVQSASVTIREPQPVVAGNIEQGLLVFLGVGQGDTENDARLLAKKIAELRIFEDTAGKMNLSLLDVGGSMLVVSQFSLYADCRKGRRPSFTAAAKPEEAERLYKIFCEAVRGQGVPVETGVFRTEMQVALVNDGPVTIWMDTAEWKTHPLAF